MNYLAHAFLSGDDPRILAGNVLADVMKHAADPRFHPKIIQGVALHRKQDAFTDAHPAFKRSRRRLQGKFRHYSAVIVDVFYDNLLAANFNLYSDEPLTGFVETVDLSFRRLLGEIEPIFTPKWRGMEWLNQYATLDGMHRAFERIAKRSRVGMDLSPAVDALEKEWAGFQDDFLLFFPDAIAFTNNHLSENLGEASHR